MICYRNIILLALINTGKAIDINIDFCLSVSSKLLEYKFRDTVKLKLLY